jgi:3'(2'), 5'-bisphosphate nucleotidase
MVDIDYESLEKIVIEAGTVARTLKSKRLKIDKTNPDNFQSEADLRIHEKYFSKLPRILNVPVLSEEDIGLESRMNSDAYWIVDPIDGTLSYINGFPTYVTQIGLVIGTMPVLGFVFAPELGELYKACRGMGATRNGKTIQVTRNSRPMTIVDNYPKPDNYVADLMSRLQIPTYLECGSIGLKICRVAEGRADIFVKHTRVFDWDVAPGSLILNEAGGSYGLISGEAYLFEASLRKPNFQASNANKLYNLDTAI